MFPHELFDAEIPVVDGRNAALAAVFKLICLSQTMPRYVKDYV